MQRKNTQVNTVVKRTQAQMIWHQLLKNKLAVLGLFVLLAFILGTAYVHFFVDYDLIVRHNYSERLQGMSSAHWFGTDAYGRDMFLRLLYGARISLSIAFFTVIGGMIFGGMIGSIAGFYGGKIDIIVMRFMDMFMAIPSMLMAICIVSVLGPGMMNLFLAITIALIPGFAMLVRSCVLTIKDSDYIEAARAGGTSTTRIILRHILPNSMGPILVQATLSMGGVILTAASLSFIGLGISPPTPEWGAILTEGQEHLREYPHLVIIPGLTIMVSVLACNFLGDGIRDALDPKLKQ